MDYGYPKHLYEEVHRDKVAIYESIRRCVEAAHDCNLYVVDTDQCGMCMLLYAFNSVKT